MFIATAYAMGASGGDAGAPAGGGASGLIMMAVIFAIFYFILIRPQQKKMKEHKKMVDDLKKGDEIITGGGIYGTVESVATGHPDGQDRRRHEGEDHPRFRRPCDHRRAGEAERVKACFAAQAPGHEGSIFSFRSSRRCG